MHAHQSQKIPMTENHDQPSLINRTQLTRQSRRGAGRWA